MTAIETVQMVKRDATPTDLDDLQAPMSRIQELLDQLNGLPSGVREIAQDCMQSLLEFYGDGLTRILEISESNGGLKITNALQEDKLISALLLIHGLHPVSLENRLLGALDKVRPYMESHGGNVELISLENGAAKLRLQGTCKSCQSSAVTMELAVRRAIEEACPDLLAFEVEGIAETPWHEQKSAEWIVIEAGAKLESGTFVRVETVGLPFLIFKIGEQFYAYADRCPVCNLPLHLGQLRDKWLHCPEDHEFDLQCAGRSRHDGAPSLTPFPLLVENGAIKVLTASNKINGVEQSGSMALRHEHRTT